MASQVKSLPVTAEGFAEEEDLNTEAFKSISLNAKDDLESNEDANLGLGETHLDEAFSVQNPFDTLANLEEEESEQIEENREVDNKAKQSCNAKMKELSRLNGQVNRMKIDQLRKRLKQHSLDTSGTKMVLQKRLKNYYRKKDLKEDYHYNYYVVIDFEATCDVQPNSYRHEIIEFPAILVSTKTRKIVGEFHTYVRPVINPKLTTFCTNLTGITQEQVNFAPEFPEVLQKFEEWLKEKNLKTDMKSFAVVTDGPWDMGRFLYHQCNISKVSFPHWGKTWINIKKPFCNFYNIERMNLQNMLAKLGMTFIGQPHSGFDDAKNIARVAIKLYEDGANMRVNEQISFKKPRSCDQKMHTVKCISRNNFNAMIKRRNVDPPKDGAGDVVVESESENDELENQDEYAGGNDRSSAEYGGPFFDSNNDEEFPSLLSKKPLKSTF